MLSRLLSISTSLTVFCFSVLWVYLQSQTQVRSESGLYPLMLPGSFTKVCPWSPVISTGLWSMLAIARLWDTQTLGFVGSQARLILYWRAAVQLTDCSCYAILLYLKPQPKVEWSSERKEQGVQTRNVGLFLPSWVIPRTSSTDSSGPFIS